MWILLAGLYETLCDRRAQEFDAKRGAVLEQLVKVKILQIFHVIVVKMCEYVAFYIHIEYAIGGEIVHTNLRIQMQLPFKLNLIQLK